MDPKELVRHFYRRLDAHEYGVYDEVCTAGFRSHLPGAAQAQTREQRRDFTKLFHAAFPDAVHEVLALVAEADLVAARLRVHGTHRGPFMGYPGSGRPIEFAATRFYRVAGGLLDEEWVSFDNLGLMRQVGATLTPPQEG